MLAFDWLFVVQTKEKKQRERIVREQMIKALQYLNQFLPPEHTIRYIGFDMAKVTKRSEVVLDSILLES